MAGLIYFYFVVAFGAFLRMNAIEKRRKFTPNYVMNALAAISWPVLFGGAIVDCIAEKDKD